MANEGSTVDDQDALWGETSTTSAFKTPQNVVESHEVKEGRVDGMDGNDSAFDETGAAHAVQEQKKTGPNYPILATFVLGLILLAGGAWWLLSSSFALVGTSAKKSVDPVEIISSQASDPVSTASVFDKDGKDIASTQDQALASTGTSAPAATINATTNSSIQTPFETKAVNSGVNSVVASVDVTAKQEKLISKPSSAVPAVVDVPQVAKLESKAEATSPASDVVKNQPRKRKVQTAEQVAKNIAQKKIKDVKIANPHKNRTKSNGASVAKAIANPHGFSAGSANLNEVVLLPKNLRVMVIYPQSGADAQAWLRHPNGHVDIVRAGDALSNGIQILRVAPESREVITSSGVINSFGAK